MVYCEYCGRWFRNKQALRAHLRHCPIKKIKPELEEKIKSEKISFAQSIIKLLKYIEATNASIITKDMLDKYELNAEDIKEVLKDTEVKKYIKGKLCRQ